MVTSRLPLAFLAALTVSLGVASAALADTSVSSNWAGYAAHRSGVRYSEVHADWVIPSVTCTAPDQTYSAMWVGLGGFAETSQALEQIGTETDCNSDGSPVTSVWYELVPAPSEPIRMTVHPGDGVAAGVQLGKGKNAKKVTLTLRDLTTHKLFKKTIKASVVDATSADWIVEAPSVCISASACQTLPLANFGTAAFGIAYAKSAAGKLGAVTSPWWGATSITLQTHARRYVTYRAGTSADGTAVPAPLAAVGSAFAVTYQAPQQVQTNPFYSARRSADAPTYIFH